MSLSRSLAQWRTSSGEAEVFATSAGFDGAAAGSSARPREAIAITAKMAMPDSATVSGRGWEIDMEVLLEQE